MLLFRSLASGSSGNAYLLRTANTSLLFEAGLSCRKLAQYVRDEGVDPAALSAVLLSHEHADHCWAAKDFVQRHDIPLWADGGMLRSAGLLGLRQAALMETGKVMVFGDIEVTTFPVSHDAARPVGFLIRVMNRTIVLATDLGEVTGEVTEAISQADLVVLEANHDSEMLHRGPYPYHLRRRVSSATGHLSNVQTARVLMQEVKGEDVEVWLAHLSKTNNTPALAKKTVAAALRAVGLDSLTLAIALRDRPSLRWDGTPKPRQLSLFPG